MAESINEPIFKFLNMDYSKLNRNTILGVSYIILALVLISWIIIKPNNMIINSEYTLNTFDNLELVGLDDLTHGSKYYTFSLEKYLVSHMLDMPPIANLILFFLIYAVTIYILYEFMIRMYVSKDIIFLFLTFFSLSPIVLYNLLSLNGYIISFFIYSLTLYCDYFARNGSKKHNLVLTLLLLFVVPFVDFFSSLIFYVFYLTYLLSVKRKSNWNFIVLILSLIPFLFMFAKFINFFSIDNFLTIRYMPFFELLSNFISDFGAHSGVNIFFFILSVVGLYRLLVIREKLRFMYLFIFILMVLHIFFIPINDFYSSLFICLLGAVGYIIFKNRNWSDTQIKSFTLLLLFCGLLFSTVSFFVRLPDFDINGNQVDFFENVNIEGSTVLSHPIHSNLLKSYGAKVLADNYDDTYGSIDSAKDQLILLESQDLNEIKQLIQNYEINFVFVSSKMRNGNPWYYRTDGLQLYFEREISGEKLFSLVHQDANYALYKVETDFLN